jgi:hypothetical protein
MVLKCWEYMACGREEGGANVKELGVCPAYPVFGRVCAKIAGTFCKGEIQGYYAQKLKDCKVCDFYNSPNYMK